MGLIKLTVIAPTEACIPAFEFTKVVKEMVIGQLPVTGHEKAVPESVQTLSEYDSDQRLKMSQFEIEVLLLSAVFEAELRVTELGCALQREIRSNARLAGCEVTITVGTFSLYKTIE